MDSDAAIAALRELGLNQVEAEVYVFLLASPPVTAYRIAQSLAKPAANVYKAVEVLARKGAILLEDATSRLCRAVPFERFLKQAERDYRQTLRSVGDALSKVERPAPDARVWRIESAQQAIETCHEMLGRARKIAVVDAFPEVLRAIAEPVKKAARRGVRVFVEAYAAIDLPGVSMVNAEFAAGAPRQWKSEQLNVVVDGREHLVALLSSDLSKVYQAVWSGSLYLSCIHHAGRLSEHTLVRMVQAREAGRPAREVLKLLEEHRFFLSDDVPGQKELLERYIEGAEISQERTG